MQIWSLIVTLLSATTRLIDNGIFVQTVTLLTNQTKVDHTTSPITLAWPGYVSDLPFNLTLKARKIVKREAAKGNGSNPTTAATADEKHHQSDGMKKAARQQQSETKDNNGTVTTSAFTSRSSPRVCKY